MSSGSESGRSAEGRVISTRLQESGLAVPSGHQEVLSTKKTEEWLTKKKTDTIVKKQIETRVKREIVVTEDGEIIEDSGPQVTTDTTEESKTEEQENTERKVCGGDNPGPGWILVPGSEVVSNTKKSNTTSHETREEKTDTEITEEVGGLSREEIVRALKQKETAALRARDSSSDVSGRVLQSAHSHKVVNTEEVDQVSDFRDGRASTQTRRSSHRQEYLDGDEPDHRAELEYQWPSVGDARSTPTLASWHGRTGGDVVRITSPSSFVQRLSSPDSPRSEPWEGVPDRGRHRKTFNWVENHFGSQDLEPVEGDGTVTEDLRNPSHYTKRQQVSVAPSPPPPPPPPLQPQGEMPRRSSKPAGHHAHNSTTRPQYYLGDDPGVGNRFTGVLSSAHANGNSRRRDADKESVPSRHSKPWEPKSATLGREPPANGRIHWSDAAPPRNRNSVRKTDPQSPTIADIIHSLRSKAFLEKENSAVSIRDDDSVFDAGGSSTLYRPTPSPVRQPAKRHVIKIAIKSDDSDCSSPVSSPRYAGTPTPSSTFEYRKGRPGEGIVKNAINSLLQNQVNGPSTHPSLPRRSTASNLKWNAHLAASSPNVHKVGFEPVHHKSSPSNGLSSGSRSRSIGNLSRPSADDGYGGSSPSPVDDYSDHRTRTATGRDRFLRQCLDDHDDDDRRCGRWYSPRVYADRIELPSPVPPVSPRSPPPPLTRPFSPPNYYNGGGHRTTRVRVEPNYRRPRPSSPSPPPPSFVRRPPSPVLPKPSSLGDDSSSNASGHSRSTNASSDVAPPSERIESTTRRRVTTTTSRRREIELPPTDYYYDSVTDGRSMPRQKNRSVVRVRD